MSKSIEMLESDELYDKSMIRIRLASDFLYVLYNRNVDYYLHLELADYMSRLKMLRGIINL